MIPQILLLAACGSAPEAEVVEAPSAVGPVTLVYTGRGEGEIEPCG